MPLLVRTWNAVLLVVLAVGAIVSGWALHAEREAAGQRLSAQAEWNALEATFISRITEATFGEAPFSSDDEAQIRARQELLVELAPYARAELDTFVTAMLALTPDEAAREHSLSQFIVSTRSAVLGPLRERADALGARSNLALGGTVALVGAAGGAALWRSTHEFT